MLLSPGISVPSVFDLRPSLVGTSHFHDVLHLILWPRKGYFTFRKYNFNKVILVGEFMAGESRQRRETE
jgi:hypothetical protein